MAETIDIPESPESNLFENLAKGMKKEDLLRIAEEVHDGYVKDKDSLTELEDMRVQYNHLFNLKNEEKSFPWPKAANVKLPSITTPCLNFQSRASTNLLPAREIVKVFTFDKRAESQQRADRVSKYMNYQLMFDMPNFRSSWDKTLMMLPKDGYAFRKVYWDSVEQKVISDYVLPQDFIVNYYTRDLETSSRYTQVMNMTENEIKIKGEQGIYIDTDKIGEPSRIEIDNVTNFNKQEGGQSAPPIDPTTPRKVIEQHTFIKMKESDEIRIPVIVTMDLEEKKIFRIISRINPNTGGQIRYFTAYTFIPNPDSIFGFGFGMLLLGANKSMNSSISMMLNAGTLSTTRGGFVLKGSQMSRGSLTYAMGEFKEVQGRFEDIKKSIIPMEFAPPSAVLMNLVQFLQNYIDGLTSVTEIVQGQAPRSDTTATAASLAVEQAAKVFTAIQQRIHFDFSKELKTIYDLDGIFVDQEEFMQVTDAPEGVDAIEDFSSDLDIRPVSDPTIISETQRLTRAEAVANAVAQNPFLAQDPRANKIVTELRMRALDIDPAIIEEMNRVMDESVQRIEQQAQMAAQQAQALGQQESAQQEMGSLEAEERDITQALNQLEAEEQQAPQ